MIPKHLVQGKKQSKCHPVVCLTGHPRSYIHFITECGDLIQALEDCHNRGMIAKFFGECNGIKHDLTMCLRAERIERTIANREKAKLRTERKEKLFKEIDEQKQ